MRAAFYFAVGFGYGLIVIGCIYLLLACNTMTSAQTAAEATWKAADMLCVSRNESKVAIDNCRDALREQYCAPDQPMIAACSDVRLSDGGKP